MTVDEDLQQWHPKYRTQWQRIQRLSTEWKEKEAILDSYIEGTMSLDGDGRTILDIIEKLLTKRLKHTNAQLEQYVNIERKYPQLIKRRVEGVDSSTP